MYSYIFVNAKIVVVFWVTVISVYVSNKISLIYIYIHVFCLLEVSHDQRACSISANKVHIIDFSKT